MVEMGAQVDIIGLLRELEEKLLTHSVRKDSAALSSLLAEEFREYGSSGRIFVKTDIIRALQSESAIQLSMKDFQACLLSDEIALVTYRAINNQPGTPAIESLRSSLWVFRGGRWQMCFHQGTRVPAAV